MGQFNKQNPAQWLNNLAMVKNRGAIRGSGGPNMPPSMMGGPNCGPNQMGPMMGGGPMGGMHMSPGMGQMGPNMGQMGPNMNQMGGNRMAGPGGQGNQMMMMKGNGNQMPGMGPGGMGPGMGPMDGFPGNNGPCGVIDGISESDLSWDTVSITYLFDSSFTFINVSICSRRIRCIQTELIMETQAAAAHTSAPVTTATQVVRRLCLRLKTEAAVEAMAVPPTI